MTVVKEPDEHDLTGDQGISGGIALSRRAMSSGFDTPGKVTGLATSVPMSRPSSAASSCAPSSRPGSAALAVGRQSNGIVRPPATEVEEWLRSINLGRYASRFAERGINSMQQLQEMSNQNIRELGMKVLEERRFLRERAARLHEDRQLLMRNQSAHIE